MADLLLSTKFFIPTLPSGWVSRPRLLKVLTQALDQPLTMISAPPGFGKTTLLADWARSLTTTPGDENSRLAWISLDADDDDLSRFWIYVLTAFQRGMPIASETEIAAGQPFEEAVNLLKTNPPPYQVFLTIIINEIVSLNQVLVLVLDDYHVIQSQVIHDSITYLIDHQPAGLHLVIASRTDPPLPLGRWRARGRLTNIRAQDLRFCNREAAEFLKSTMGVSLAEEHVAELGLRTEGWIAGLQMAAITLQEQDTGSIAQTITAFSGRHRFLLDYFTDEILNRQSEAVQRFLLSTSILDRMCAELAAAVLEDDGPGSKTNAKVSEAQAALEYLERANLFVVPLDSERRWYRYHHLFADLLCARLRQTTPPQMEAQLRQRASHWCAQNGFVSEAVGQAIQAQAYDLAADTVEAAANIYRIWDTGEVGTLIKWIDALPLETVQNRLWLRILQSRSIYFTGQADVSEAILDEIERRLTENPGIVPDPKLLMGYLLATRARYASVRGETYQAFEISDRALNLLAPNDLAGRNWVLPTKAYSALVIGNPVEAAQLFTESAEMSHHMGSTFGRTGTLCNLARTRTIQGQLGEAVRLSQEGIRQGTIQGTALPVAGWPRFSLSEALYEQNRLEEADGNLVEGLRLTRLGNLTEYYGLMPALLARIRLDRGQTLEAHHLMEEALEIARRSTVSMYISIVEAYRARLWLRLGETGRAAEWAETYTSRKPSEYLTEVEETCLGYILLQTGKPDTVVGRLEPLAADAQARGRHGREIEMRILLALAYSVQGKHPAALDALLRALQIGEPESCLRPFLEPGASLTRLVQEISSTARAGVSRRYLNEILNALHPGEYLSVAPNAGAHPLLIEALTPREMEVLRLLAEGLSNRQIADRLYLSPNTLRVYTTNIYAKLDVHNRTQAVTKAQTLKLI